MQCPTLSRSLIFFTTVPAGGSLVPAIIIKGNHNLGAILGGIFAPLVLIVTIILFIVTVVTLISIRRKYVCINFIAFFILLIIYFINNHRYCSKRIPNQINHEVS